MISLPNIIVSESIKNTEITDELVSKIAEKSFSAAEIDSSNLESYLQATAQAAGSLYKINYSGGNLEVEVKETRQIVQKTADLKLKTLQFKRKIMEYQSALGEFKLAYVQSFYYSLFIIISINNSILTSSQLIYELFIEIIMKRE